MGPRARARGNMRRPSGPRCCSELQWGRERALAEIRPLRSKRMRTVRASMGPRARARGNFRIVVVGGSDRMASMGPRARARGNILKRIYGPADRLASMGPRARARGNYLVAAERRDSARGFNGAASARSRKWSLPAILHSFVSASMGPRARARGNVPCLLLLWFGRYAS